MRTDRISKQILEYLKLKRRECGLPKRRG